LRDGEGREEAEIIRVEERGGKLEWRKGRMGRKGR
jgi:hypothetical protein